MKRIIFFSILIITTALVADANTVEEAKELITQRKYLSAYEILDEADFKNENPDIVVLKTDIVLKYFVQSSMHVMFALRDLKPGDDLLEIRRSMGSFSMRLFDPAKELSKLIKKYPKNYKLYRALGFYYNEVYNKYGSRWKMPPEQIVDLFEINYKIAYDNGVYDHWSLYGIGYAKMKKKKYRDAIPYLEKSISMKDDDPTCHYNLAYSCLLANQSKRGVKNAVIAFKLYDYKPYKADAARVAGFMYNDLKDYKKAKEYLIKSDKVVSNNYNTYKELLRTEFYLKSNDHDKWAKKIFKISRENADYYSEIVKIYFEHEKQNDMLQLLNEMKKDKNNSDLAMGSLYFFSSMIYYENSDYDSAKKGFDKAESYFRKIFKDDHYVFGVINEAREKMKKNEI